MNDDFLTHFRKSPRREFSEALYERISTEMNTQQKFNARRIMFAGALGLALVAAFAFSAAAQAALDRVVREIGGVTFLGPDETEASATPVPESQVISIALAVSPGFLEGFGRQILGSLVVADAISKEVVDAWQFCSIDRLEIHFSSRFRQTHKEIRLCAHSCMLYVMRGNVSQESARSRNCFIGRQNSPPAP